jgi:hypothetical protein
MTAKSRFFELLAARVAAGCSIKQAAKAIGCSESTAQRLNRLPEFAGRVLEIRAALSDAIVGQLIEGASDAVAALTAIVRNPDSRPADVIAASRTILQTLLPIQDAVEFRSRLDRLEQSQLRRVG